MKLKPVLKRIIRIYYRISLGAVGQGSDISLSADLRGVKRKIFIGQNSNISKHVSLEVDTINRSKSQIIIGDNTLISSFVILRTYGGTIKIGNSCFVNSFSTLYGHGDLTIGNGVLIGPQVTIIPANYGFKDRHIPFREQVTSIKGITIKDNVWIGAGVTILDGCTIGEGSIIGAGAVVTKNVAAYSIIAGVPAKVIGSRA